MNQISSYYNIFSLTQEFLSIPIYVYEDSSLKDAYPQQTAITYPPARYISEIHEQLKNSPCTYTLYSTSYSVWYAGFSIIDTPGQVVIVGPVCAISFEEEINRKMFQEYQITKNTEQIFIEYLSSISPISSYDFFRKAIFLNYLFNHELICPQDFSDTHSTYKDNIQRMTTLNTLTQYKHQLNELPIASYELESLLCHYVRNGDIKGLHNFFHTLPQYHNGTLAHTPLRSEKNNFIAMITLVSRAAMEGNLPKATTYLLSDLYIQEVETIEDFDGLHLLYFQALRDFTSRVAQLKLPESNNPIVQKCINYIIENSSKKFTTEDIAKALNCNRSYLSSLFKKEMGVTLCYFITSYKLERGKTLLLYTNKSISEISSFLSFSNQSQFQTQFKKQYGITPNQYRRQGFQKDSYSPPSFSPKKTES